MVITTMLIYLKSTSTQMGLHVTCVVCYSVGSVRGDLQWSECWDLNDLGSLRGGGVEVPHKPGSLVLLDHFESKLPTPHLRMQVVWFNHGYRSIMIHEAGVFRWNTKMIKIHFSIESIEIFLHEDQFLPKWYDPKNIQKTHTHKKLTKNSQSGPIGGQQAGSLAVGGEGSRH